MAFSSGKALITVEDILSRVTEAQILSFYLNINNIPCLIHSPLREDKNPSFGIYSPDGKKIKYIDFSTRERGNIFDLLKNLWSCSFYEVLLKIKKDMSQFFKCSTINKISKSDPMNNRMTVLCENTRLECKVRNWKTYDIEYWKSFGITLNWLKYANVYPISHKIVIKGDKRYIFAADKYAYAYVEFKDGKTTIKIYQPLNKKGFKWSSGHDGSVISLWTKIPEYGDKVCICSSLKDALCLWANTGIPSIAIQGEGYRMSNTAIKELKRRYKDIFILLDNDKTGITDGKKLAELTGFNYLELPKFKEGKDISDLYKSLNNKQLFYKTILNLFNYDKKRDLCSN